MIISNKSKAIENVPFSIQIYVRNIKKALYFYHKILGFEIIRKHPNKQLVVLSFHDSIIILNSERGREKIKHNPGIQLRFLLKGGRKILERYYEELKSKRVKIIKPIKKRTYGLLTFHIKDPNGLELKFCSMDKI